MSRVFPISLLMATALLVHAGAVAAIEKWVDAKGRVHYGDRPPPGVETEVVRIRPNVIETGRPGFPVPFRARPAPVPTSTSPSPVGITRPDIESYVERCRANRGIDCELEARQMIDGPAPVVFPGDPLIFPRPDLKPPPPGLPLKRSIEPQGPNARLRPRHPETPR